MSKLYKDENICLYYKKNKSYIELELTLDEGYLVLYFIPINKKSYWICTVLPEFEHLYQKVIVDNIAKWEELFDIYPTLERLINHQNSSCKFVRNRDLDNNDKYTWLILIKANNLDIQNWNDLLSDNCYSYIDKLLNETENLTKELINNKPNIKYDISGLVIKGAIILLSGIDFFPFLDCLIDIGEPAFDNELQFESGFTEEPLFPSNNLENDFDIVNNEQININEVNTENDYNEIILTNQQNSIPTFNGNNHMFDFCNNEFSSKETYFKQHLEQYSLRKTLNEHQQWHDLFTTDFFMDMKWHLESIQSYGKLNTAQEELLGYLNSKDLDSILKFYNIKLDYRI